MMVELRNIQESLKAGEKEKEDLIKSLRVLGEDLSLVEGLKFDPNATGFSSTNILNEKSSEKHSTASQTDFCGEVRLIYLYN